MKKKIIGILFMLTVFLIAIQAVGIVRMAKQPNIALIIIDTLRADKLGCYGFPEEISPEIDKLANKGLQFKNVIAQCSWTRPSIGSMITSLYPRSIGIYVEREHSLHDKFLTLAEILRQEGYITVGITANPNINSVFNFHQGFDYYIDSDVIWPWMPLGKAEKKISQEKEIYLASDKEIYRKVLNLALRKKNRPWYVQINVMDVHQSWRDVGIRSEFKKMFNNAEEPCECNYLRAVRQSSKDVHEFIQELLLLPNWKNTLFIITSDHGEGLHDHPDVYKGHIHGYTLYSSNIKVPLIFYHPAGTLRHGIVKERVRLLDLMPTILDYVGLSIPDSIEGKSLLRLINDEESNIALPAHFVLETNWRDIDKIAAYSEHWEYIENHDGQVGVNRRELQPGGIKENGILTDKVENEIEAVARFEKFLKLWESRHQKASPTLSRQEPSLEEVEQMKTLGYLQ